MEALDSNQNKGDSSYHQKSTYFFPFKLILKDQYACKFCNKVLAENVTHFNEHMTDRKSYIEKTITSTIQSNNPFNTMVIAKPSQQLNQMTINFPRLTPAQKKEIDLQAAMWC